MPLGKLDEVYKHSQWKLEYNPDVEHLRTEPHMPVADRDFPDLYKHILCTQKGPDMQHQTVTVGHPTRVIYQ